MKTDYIKAKMNVTALIKGLKTHRNDKTIDELAESVGNKYLKALERLARYEEIRIGMDVGVNDGTSLVIATPFNDDKIYMLHSKVYQPSEEICLKLKDLIDRIETDKFVDVEEFFKRSD
jgi:hypothetical protein